MAKSKRIEPVKIGVVGGSGFYEIEGIKDLKEVKIKTPFGNPSDSIIVGNLEGVRCAFLPRHGKGHKIMPSELNFRANIYALKSLGVEQVLSISACGSLKEEVRRREFLIPDQLFDRTKHRISSFFGNGIVAHVGIAEPFCNSMRNIVYESMKESGLTCHMGGTYVCIEGPQFSTKAESEVNRQLGFSIVGMTAIPEAKLAREAEMCYTTIGLVTDYDVWKEGEEVTVEAVVKNLLASVSDVKVLLKKVLPKLNNRKIDCECSSALKYSVISKLDNSNKKTYATLKLFLDKYYKKGAK